MNKKITLIITGQSRLKENQNIIEKINYHIEKIKPHETIISMWENEYHNFKNEIKSLNIQKIIIPENLPNINNEIIDNMIKAHNKQNDTKIIYNQENANIKFYHNVLKQIFLLQYTFQNIKTNSNIYIKTRYDNIYLNDFKYQELINNFYHDNNPIISTPFGGDYDNIGLGDLITITNQKANKILQNIYNTYIKLLNEQNTPMNVELYLRLLFKNINQADIYRFHSLITTEKYSQRNLIYHANRNIFQQHGFNNIGEIIAKDNTIYKTNN